MDIDNLKQILELVREHDLSEFEIEHEGLKLKIRKDAARGASSTPVVPPTLTSGAVSTPPAPTPSPPLPGAPDPEADAAEEVELAVVKSPIVGTFYRSSEPSAPPFVEIGSVVKKGQVLCIIEAMKLMNEIECDVDGTVVQVFPKNSQPVEFGEQLFAIRVD